MDFVINNKITTTIVNNKNKKMKKRKKKCSSIFIIKINKSLSFNNNIIFASINASSYENDEKIIYKNISNLGNNKCLYSLRGQNKSCNFFIKITLKTILKPNKHTQ